MSDPAPELSFVIPAHNEEASLPRLISALSETAASLNRSYEVIIVDDGSTDRSWAVLAEKARQDARIRGLRLGRNCGQSAAMWAGLKAARGRILVTLDADLQNDPADIVRLLDALQLCDCACGTRVESRRQGDGFIRIASSRIANGVRNRLSGDSISDAGCCFRAFKRECVEPIKFFKGMHRFLPTLFRMEGFTVTEVPVRHHPRVGGQTHYGVWNRVFASFYDLLAVRWMKKRMFRFDVTDRLN